MKNIQQWTLTDKKKQIIVRPIKLSLFQQCKLIECEEESTGVRYVLFFYQNDFLTAQLVQEHESTSFLALVETDGIHLKAPSPLFSSLVQQASSLEVIPINQLLSQLKRTYTTTETALIYSYFDSYLPLHQLDKVLKELFFSYRRNGQLATAYRLAIILHARGYNEEWVLSTTKHLDYANAAKRYQASPASLLSIDPLYVEQQCFLNGKKKKDYELLLTIYAEQQNVFNTLLLAIDMWITNPTENTYKTLIHTLSLHLQEDEVLTCLHSLLDNAPIASGLHQDVYDRLIKKERYQQAIQLVLTYSFPLTPQQQDQLPAVFEQTSINELHVPIKDISAKMFTLLAEQPLVLERLIRSALPALLQSDNLQDIQAWLQSNQVTNDLPIIKKVNKMTALLDEPDKQMELGQYYYELEQYEQAIECFSWEMELHPNEHDPVQWLAKSYQMMGKTAEAKTYQQLLSQLQQSS